jgi:hypothetical protein
MIGVEDNDNKRGREAEAEEGRKLTESPCQAIYPHEYHQVIILVSYWYYRSIG